MLQREDFTFFRYINSHQSRCSVKVVQCFLCPFRQATERGLIPFSLHKITSTPLFSKSRIMLSFPFRHATERRLIPFLFMGGRRVEEDQGQSWQKGTFSQQMVLGKEIERLSAWTRATKSWHYPFMGHWWDLIENIFFAYLKKSF